MAPLSSTKIIPDVWAEHHRPVAASTMTADAQVLRPNPDPMPYPPDESWQPFIEVWAGKVRVQELKQETSALPGWQPTYGRAYLVTFPMTAGNPLPVLSVGEGGDIVRAVGFDFILQYPMAGSLLWEHDYLAWVNHTQQGGTSG